MKTAKPRKPFLEVTSLVIMLTGAGLVLVGLWVPGLLCVCVASSLFLSTL